MAKQTIHDVLAHFREEATSNRDLGDRFERLICRYLELDLIRVSMETNRIVASLPALNERR